MLGLTSVCVFLFSALALAVNSGYSLGALVLLLASSWLLWKRPRLHLQRRDYLLMGVMLAYFLIFTANMLYHGDPGREFDIPLRALLAVPVLLLLLAYPPAPAAWWGGLSIGAIAGVMLATWQLLALQMERPLAATSNAIHYGNVSMLFGMLALCGLGWARAQSQRTAWTLLLLVGGLAGILGSLISGSRSGWLALPICICCIAVHYAKAHGQRYLGGALALLLVLGAAAYLMPNSTLRERATTAMSELEEFDNNDNINTSIGERMEMWRMTLQMVDAHNMWTGMGRTGYLARKYALADEGKMTAVIRNYTNAHNDYLDVLVKRGITGVLALLALFLVPLALFARALRRGGAAAQPYALAGVVLCTCYMIFGLTTSSLTLNIGIIMLVFPMVILWSMLRQQERTS